MIRYILVLLLLIPSQVWGWQLIGSGVSAPSCSTSNDNDTLEVVSTSTGGGTRAISSTSWRAQSFTNENAFTVSCVLIRLSDTGSDVGNFTLQLRSDNSGTPSSTVLASASLAATNIAASETNYEMCFSSPATGLSASTRYWIVGGADAGGFTLHRNTDNQYANGGESASTDGGSTWGAETASNDYTMTIRGCEP
jgi:hypothetical protein